MPDTNGCERGHEFLTVKAKMVKRGNTTMAQNIKCPGCGKAFAQLPTRAKDNAVYLPRHGNGAPVDKVPPKEPAATAA